MLPIQGGTSALAGLCVVYQRRVSAGRRSTAIPRRCSDRVDAAQQFVGTVSACRDVPRTTRQWQGRCK